MCAQVWHIVDEKSIDKYFRIHFEKIWTNFVTWVNAALVKWFSIDIVAFLAPAGAGAEVVAKADQNHTKTKSNPHLFPSVQLIG